MKNLRTHQALKTRLIKQINRTAIKPNKHLGQNFLIDQIAIDLLHHCAHPENTIIEIGAGTGILTDSLATKAQQVIAIEIDRQFHPILKTLQSRHHNLQIIYENALNLDWTKLAKLSKTNLQLISNLPYHITEPFFHLIIKLPISNLTVLIGKNAYQKIQASPKDGQFSHLSLLCQSFYDIELLLPVNRNSFYPISKTDSMIVRLTRKPVFQVKNNLHDTVMQSLFLNYHDNFPIQATVKHHLSGLIQPQSSWRNTKKSRREHKIAMRDLVNEINHQLENNTFGIAQLFHQNTPKTIKSKINIPEEILKKPLRLLQNHELRTLSLTLNN